MSWKAKGNIWMRRSKKGYRGKAPKGDGVRERKGLGETFWRNKSKGKKVLERML